MFRHYCDYIYSRSFALNLQMTRLNKQTLFNLTSSFFFFLFHLICFQTPFILFFFISTALSYFHSCKMPFLPFFPNLYSVFFFPHLRIPTVVSISRTYNIYFISLPPHPLGTSLLLLLIYLSSFRATLYCVKTFQLLRFYSVPLSLPLYFTATFSSISYLLQFYSLLYYW